MQEKMMDKMPKDGKAIPKQGLSPEQQKQFDTVSKQALSFLLEDSNAKLIIDKAKASDPKTAIVESVTPVLQGVWASIEEAGANVEMHIFLAASLNVITILADMMAVAGVIQEDQVQQLATQAAQEAVQQHNAGVQSQQPPPDGLVATAQGGM